MKRYKRPHQGVLEQIKDIASKKELLSFIEELPDGSVFVLSYGRFEAETDAFAYGTRMSGTTAEQAIFMTADSLRDLQDLVRGICYGCSDCNPGEDVE